jgi:Glycosyltransferase family 9 (heptosyltransferase)
VSLCPGMKAPPWMREFVPNDWRDSASLMTHMDLVVSVDTAVAHLAGAMDIKTLVLVPCCSDWKWFTGTDKSPWYNSMTVLRSVFPSRFSGVIEDAAKLIRGWW